MHSRVYPEQKTSNELALRARDLLPARSPKKCTDLAPKYLERGRGCHVWDIDGNEYIDLIMGNGQISLGYNYDVVDQALRDQLHHGIGFSCMHPLELEVAEIIRDTVPGAEAVWFCRAEEDVRSAAVRLAQTVTGRSKVLCCHNHSNNDWTVPFNGAFTPATSFIYNDLNSVETLIDDSVACVILEPAMFEEPRDQFLQQIRRLCTKNGSLLIFDETWTGFRIAIGGAQEHFGTIADLACFSNGIANGMLISVLTGCRSTIELVDTGDSLFTATGTEILALAAAEATLNEIRERNVPQHISHWNRCLRDGYNRIALELQVPYTQCVGLDHRTMITFDDSAGDPNDMKQLLQLELFRHGVLWNGFHNLSASHKYKDISHILSAYAEALSVLKCAVEAKQVREYIDR